MVGNTINVQGSYIDVHDNEHVYLSVDKAEVSVKNAVQETLEHPAELATPRAQELWEEAQEQGWVDEHLQPLVSRPLAALLADRMAEVLDIRNKWKAFELMWNRKHMRNDYNTALDQQQCDDFRKKLMRVIR